MFDETSMKRITRWKYFQFRNVNSKIPNIPLNLNISNNLKIFFNHLIIYLILRMQCAKILLSTINNDYKLSITITNNDC